jgi:hypothetical protein
MTSIEPLERHAEWTAATVTDPSEWTHCLGDGEVAELEEALAVARSHTDELLDVDKSRFPLPDFGRRLAGVTEELINGRGFQRITGLPVDRLGAEDSSWIYWGIGMHLGVPWPQNARGHLLGDVKDEGRRMSEGNSRGYQMAGPLPFHSDGSDLVGLLCLSNGVSGGESLIANALLCHNLLAESDPELAAVMYDGLPYDYRGEEAEGGRPYYTIPAFTRHEDRLFIRYIPPFIKASQRHEGAPRLTEQQQAAMAAYDALVADPAHQVEMTFEPGDMQFINNYHVLHGRRTFEDDHEAGNVRWLKRLWLATDLLATDDRPERFQADRAFSHWSEKRTKA